jgi:hypothetical protein
MRTIFLPVFLFICIQNAPADCKQPLDAQTLEQLRLGWTDVQLRPGDTYQFALAILSTYMPAQEVPACATWKVEPEGKGATINPSGLLKIDSTAPAGAKFVVTADIEKGRAVRKIVVIIYTDKSQPLVGFWKQQSRFGCQPGELIGPGQPIQELEFRADGQFAVTWTPFEVYHDYWGSYEADSAGQAVSFKIEQGNYIPADFRGKGKYKLKNGTTLELSGIYFGDRYVSGDTKNHKINPKCHYIFTRIQ